MKRTVLALAVSEDGHWIATAEREDPQDGQVSPTVVVLRDRKTFREVRQWQVVDLQQFGTTTEDTPDQEAEDVAKGRQRTPTVFASSGLIFSPDSKTIAWSRAGIQCALDVAMIDSDQPCASIPLATGSWCFQFSPDGTRIASGSVDSTVNIWDWKNAVFAVGPR